METTNEQGGSESELLASVTKCGVDPVDILIGFINIGQRKPLFFEMKEITDPKNRAVSSRALGLGLFSLSKLLVKPLNFMI